MGVVDSFYVVENKFNDEIVWGCADEQAVVDSLNSDGCKAFNEDGNPLETDDIGSYTIAYVDTYAGREEYLIRFVNVKA